MAAVTNAAVRTLAEGDSDNLAGQILPALDLTVNKAGIQVSGVQMGADIQQLSWLVSGLGASSMRSEVS